VLMKTERGTDNRQLRAGGGQKWTSKGTVKVGWEGGGGAQPIQPPPALCWFLFTLRREHFLTCYLLTYLIQDYRSYFAEAGDNTGPLTVEDKFFQAEVCCAEYMTSLSLSLSQHTVYTELISPKQPSVT